MGKTVKRPAVSKEKRGKRKASKKMSRKPTNLSLDPEAIAQGERYGRRHGASLSQLVSDLLRALPAGTGEVARAELTPPVQRLYGIAARGAADRETHRKHLLVKYRSEPRR